jgi:tetratricopeptide (TPR) repeat protein
VRRAKQLLLSSLVVGGVAVGLLVAGAVGGSLRPQPTNPPTPDVARSATLAGTLAGTIAAAQKQLAATPGDARTWAALAIDYVAQAKATVDPSYYPKAEGAVAKSLALDSRTNDAGYAALAALRNAEHDFRAALVAARKGLAINGYSSTLYGALADAYTQLGRYADAARAVDRMNRLLPGVPAFARASYVFELRGDTADARQALDRALQDATNSGDVAFARTYLGELELNYGGDPRAALAQFQAGLLADPGDHGLRAGQAKALAALGRTTQAIAAYASLVSAAPQPQYVLEYGELLESQHDPGAARQYELFRIEEQLFRANHVVLDAEPTLFEADHGSPAKALQYAEAGWRTRPFLEMADAYAWALYANNRDAEALRWSDRALATGWTNALFHFHRGMIERSLQRPAAARADLQEALSLNPHFSALHVSQARAALVTLRS